MFIVSYRIPGETEEATVTVAYQSQVPGVVAGLEKDGFEVCVFAF